VHDEDAIQSYVHYNRWQFVWLLLARSRLTVIARVLVAAIIDIYAVVSMDPGDQTVRLEFAVKQGVRPFGPQLLANQRFSLDASFREFFFSKRTFKAFPGGHLYSFIITHAGFC
jgi:hypothetical protein